jgi:hypothetical protein
MKINCEGRDGEDIAADIRNIKAFPCTLEIYDRVLILRSRDEAVLFASGIEIGYFTCSENRE